MVTAMSNGVMRANDHSTFGYFLRLTLLGRMAPLSFGGDEVYTRVDAQALAEGLCLAAEWAHLDYASAKAQRELGWAQPDLDTMRDPIIEREQLAKRQGFLGKLRHQAMVDGPG